MTADRRKAAEAALAEAVRGWLGDNGDFSTPQTTFILNYLAANPTADRPPRQPATRSAGPAEGVAPEAPSMSREEEASRDGFELDADGEALATALHEAIPHYEGHKPETPEHRAVHVENAADVMLALDRLGFRLISNETHARMARAIRECHDEEDE